MRLSPPDSGGESLPADQGGVDTVNAKGPQIPEVEPAAR